MCEMQEPGAHSNKRLPDSRFSKADILRLESKVDSVSQFLSTASLSWDVSRSPSISPFPNPLPGIVPEDILPDIDEEEPFLGLFRKEMAPLFPFVVIEDDVTAEQLRLEKPILYLSIMMSACQGDLERQLRLGQLVRYEISQAFGVNCEKSFALLEGLLVFIGWNHVHMRLGTMLTSALHLAVALMTELGLSKEAHVRSQTSAGAIGTLGQSRTTGVIRTPKERRALLGIFWLHSTIKSTVKDIEAIRYTRYMDACCQILEEANERPGDVYLVQLVRLQQKADLIRKTLYNEDFEPILGLAAPLVMSIQTLEKEIQEIGSTLTLGTNQAPLLRMSFHTVSLYLYKIALDDRLFTVQPTPTIGSLPSTTNGLLRNNLLTSCLYAAQALLDLFFDLPANIISNYPYPHWGGIGHATAIISRLSEVKQDAWGSTYISTVFDHRETFRRVAEKIEEVISIGKGQVPPRKMPEDFSLMASRLRDLSGSVAPPAGSQSMSAEELVLDEEMLNSDFFNFFDFGQAV